jgi:hypothetical protein
MALFRGMTADATDGFPFSGNTAGGLGARPKVGRAGDIPVANGLVSPNSGGMSTAFSDPMAIPGYRRPTWMKGGTQRHYQMYLIDDALVPGDLVARPDDPKSPLHRSVEPIREMSFEEYVRHILSTRQAWRVYGPFPE